MFILHFSILKQKSLAFLILLNWGLFTLVWLAVNCFWTAIFKPKVTTFFTPIFLGQPVLAIFDDHPRFLGFAFWTCLVFLKSPFWLFPSVFAEKTASQAFTLKVASKCFYWPTNPRRSSRWWRRWAGSEAAQSSLSSKPDRRPFLQFDLLVFVFNLFIS